MATGFNETLQWTMGLINASGKYLTAETFGFKITANGANMKVKQIWTLETKSGDDQFVYLRSPHKRYLSANEKGEVSASSEEMNENERFIFLPQADGRCALKSPHGYYFGGSGDQLSCFTKTISETELWTVHLSMHPQINLRNVQRKCYAHLVGDELHVDEEVPWGADAMLTLEFVRDSGRYRLLASNNKYLTCGGQLTEDASKPETCFQLEFHGSTIAFKDCNGKYLAGVGSKGTLQSRRDVVDKDERFVLEDSHPQATIIAANGRAASITRGTEVAASMSEDEVGDKETFQFEINKETNKWSVRASSKNYWTAAGATIQATAAQRDDACWYDVKWDGQYIMLQTCSGKFVTMKPNGTLATNGEDGDDPKCRFIFTLINRPILVLRGEYGFIQPKSGKSGRYDCNRSGYEVLKMSATRGVYTLVGANGKPWGMDEATKSFSADGDADFNVSLELVRHTRMLIKCPNGSYLRGESNGLLGATGAGLDKETLWEY
ncbi:fascin-like [Sycon ciliatum]|uniref:fascin-like n=1 Tax=Sycon ciliatum TaxID=27933 RepID=UPI0031F69170